MAKQKYVVLNEDEVLIYKGMEIDQDVLDAVIDSNKRLLWAFVRGTTHGTVRAVPYSEERVIWLAESDIIKEQDVEI